jgi:hypothetical protein
MSLAGGVVPGMAAGGALAAGRAMAGGRTALDAFTPSGRNRIAGQILNRNAGDRDAALAALENNATELVPGSLPTAAQASGDRGLAVLEKGLASSGPAGAALQERYLAQGAARQAAIRQGLEAQAPYGGQLSVDDVGTRIRDAYDSAYSTARQATRQAYNEIDPEGWARFSLEPLADDFQAVIGTGRYAEVPAPVSSLMTKIRDDIRNGQTVQYRDLQDMRTMLTDMAESAAITGDAPTRRIAAGMKSRLDAYIEEGAQAPELYGRRTVPQKGTRAYNEASRLARESIENDPYYDDLKYLTERGINAASAQAIIGSEGVRELQRLAPGLIRKNGKIQVDTIGDSLAGANIYGMDENGRNASGQRLLEMLVDRLGPGRGRMQADLARRRDEILLANAQPHTGFAAPQIDAFNRAKELRRVQGRRFESGANIPLSRRGQTLEGEGIATSRIPENFFRPGQQGAEGMRAFDLSVGGNGGARNAMADYAVSQALQGATDASGAINLNRLTNWTRARQPALQQMGMADMAALPAVRQDLARSQTAQNLAGVRGSPTAQNLATQAIVDKIIGDTRISADTGGVTSAVTSALTAIPRWAAGKVGDFVFQPANEAVRDILIDSMTDPATARRLMQNSRYTPKGNLGGLLGELARGYGVSQIPVTTGLLGRLLEEEDDRGRSGGGGARSSADLPVGMIEPGNIDLSARPIVENSNGSYSTVLSRGFNIDGREVLLPTVSDDGRILTDDEAVEQYRRTGKHLGIFDTPADSTAYAESLHEAQDRQYRKKRNRKR